VVREPARAALAAGLLVGAEVVGEPVGVGVLVLGLGEGDGLPDGLVEGDGLALELDDLLGLGNPEELALAEAGRQL
jgi:hypothetical protein